METTGLHIRLGISACLLGRPVRYDGGHRLDRYLRDTLGAVVEWIPVCPAVECGLSVPREAMRLVDDNGRIRLVTRHTRTDHTDRLLRWAGQKLDALAGLDLGGFVFKSRSPSSGMSGVKVYPPEGGVPKKTGVGLFAGAFMKRFPFLPVEDDGRLNDPALRENFIERIFVLGRWQQWIRDNPSMAGWIAFHTEHKLLVMAHSPTRLKELGKKAAERNGTPLGQRLDDYLLRLMEALRLEATVKKNVNVLQHAMGYFKKRLTPDEKRELLETIGDYHRGFVPLVVPITLLRHYVRKYDDPYLKHQWYLNPHPKELMLRNRV